MPALPYPGIDRAARARLAPGTWAALCIGALLALSANEACAAALGSFASSVGLLSALAALFVVKGWPAHLPASALSTAGGALVVAGGAAWWWRTRAAERLAGFVPMPGPGAGGVVRPRPGAMGRTTEIILPTGWDRARLLAELRRLFVQLQDAWDRREMPALAALTTAEMLAELCLELPGRVASGDEPRSIEVVTLQADLLGFEVLAQAFVVSVEFSGLIRESVEGGAVPFRELWMLTRSNSELAGWRLARHQVLL